MTSQSRPMCSGALGAHLLPNKGHLLAPAHLSATYGSQHAVFSRAAQAVAARGTPKFGFGEEQWSVECRGCRWEDPPGPEMLNPFHKILKPHPGGVSGRGSQQGDPAQAVREGCIIHL